MGQSMAEAGPIRPPEMGRNANGVKSKSAEKTVCFPTFLKSGGSEVEHVGMRPRLLWAVLTIKFIKVEASWRSRVLRSAPGVPRSAPGEPRALFLWAKRRERGGQVLLTLFPADRVRPT